MASLPDLILDITRAHPDLSHAQATELALTRWMRSTLACCVLEASEVKEPPSVQPEPRRAACARCGEPAHPMLCEFIEQRPICGACSLKVYGVNDAPLPVMLAPMESARGVAYWLGTE